MEEKLQEYKVLAEKEENQAPNPFEHISQRILNKKGVITKNQMIEEYLKQMENDLKKNFSGIASPMETSSKNGEINFLVSLGKLKIHLKNLLKKNSLTIFLKESGRH